MDLHTAEAILSCMLTGGTVARHDYVGYGRKCRRNLPPDVYENSAATIRSWHTTITRMPAGKCNLHDTTVKAHGSSRLVTTLTSRVVDGNYTLNDDCCIGNPGSQNRATHFQSRVDTTTDSTCSRSSDTQTHYRGQTYNSIAQRQSIPLLFTAVTFDTVTDE